MIIIHLLHFLLPRRHRLLIAAKQSHVEALFSCQKMQNMFMNNRAKYQVIWSRNKDFRKEDGTKGPAFVRLNTLDRCIQFPWGTSRSRVLQDMQIVISKDTKKDRWSVQNFFYVNNGCFCPNKNGKASLNFCKKMKKLVYAQYVASQ